MSDTLKVLGQQAPAGTTETILILYQQLPKQLLVL